MVSTACDVNRHWGRQLRSGVNRLLACIWALFVLYTANENAEYSSLAVTDLQRTGTRCWHLVTCYVFWSVTGAEFAPRRLQAYCNIFSFVTFSVCRSVIALLFVILSKTKTRILQHTIDNLLCNFGLVIICADDVGRPPGYSDHLTGTWKAQDITGRSLCSRCVSKSTRSLATANRSRVSTRGRPSKTFPRFDHNAEFGYCFSYCARACRR